jgi:putative peptidoglycan lipid II flippase
VAEVKPVAVARSGLVMAAGTLSSRLLGLVRVVLLAGIIGTTGLTAEAFQVANTLPNQFYLILAGGILNAVLVPQIIKADTHADGGLAFVNRIITLSLLLLVAATTVTMLAGPFLVRLYFDTRDESALALSTTFAFVCLPQIFFYGLYTVLGQLLTARGRFAAYMWAPVVANVVALSGLVAFLALGLPEKARPGEWTPLMIGVLGGSATLSIALQALFLLIPLRRMGFSYRPTFGFRGVGLGSASRVAKWTFAAVLIAQLGFVVTSKVLTWATDSVPPDEFVPGRASFDTAFLLFMLPHSLVTVSLVTALYTRMARAVASDNRAELRADLLKGLRLPAVVLVPGVVVAIVFAPVLLRAFLVRNTLAETDAVALVTTALLFGVIPYGWLYLSDRFFYAHEDARTPFVVQLLVTGLSVVGALVGRGLGPHSAAATIGLTQSMAYAVGAGLGFVLIRRRLGGIGLWPVVSTYLRLGIPAVLLALVARWLVGAVLPDLLREGKVVSMGVAFVAGVFVLTGTWLAAHTLRVPEVGELLGPLLRRLRRR